MLMELLQCQNDKGQVSLEFMIIAAVSIVFTLGMMTVIVNVSSEKVDQQTFNELREFGAELQQEFVRAGQMNDGYERTLFIPEDFNDRNYTIYVDQIDTGSTIVIGFIDDREIYYDIPKVDGDLVKGVNNTIRKDDEGMRIQ